MFEKNVFIHHVYFWLKEKDNTHHLDQLHAGLAALSALTTIKAFHIGVPADTNRDVIDSSYAISWLLLFNNSDDQLSYQTDPMHLKFIADCAHLWSKVQVYDTVGK